jgi:hypothetical protein
MEIVGTFYGHLEYFKAIPRYILWPFGNVVVIRYVFPFLVYFVKKNLATLWETEASRIFLCFWCLAAYIDVTVGDP